MLYIFIRVFALELVGLEKNITKLHFKPPKLVIFPTVKQVCVMFVMSVSVWQFVWWGVSKGSVNLLITNDYLGEDLTPKSHSPKNGSPGYG